MKKKILRMGTGLIIASTLFFPSCDLFDQCGECTKVTEDNEGNITLGKPEFVCGNVYLSYKDSEIKNTIDGKEYWDCE